MAEQDGEAQDQGASPWEQLLYASKSDSAEMAEAALNNPKLGDDVNKQDGMGLTALHHAAKVPSPDVLELLLEHDGTDVDPQDRLDGHTPLHYAVRIQHKEARDWTVRSLLEAGADPRIANKHREKPVEILAKDDPLREDFTRAEAELAMDNSDLVRDNDSDVAGEEGGDSGEE